MDESLVSIGLSPNVLPDDVALAREVLFQPARWYNTDSSTRLKETLAHTLGHPISHTFLSISGRSALHQILTAIGVGAGDEVAMQAFNCVAVSNSIKWLGATPLFVDIEKNTLNMDFEDLQKKVTSRTKVIIVQHTFGLPVSYMPELLTWAHERNILVVGDCAHATGATLHKRSITEFGDFSFISFGRDKVISSVFGGAFFVHEDVDPVLYARIQKEVESQPPVDRAWIAKQLVHPLLTNLILQTYDVFMIGQLLNVLFSSVNVLSKATSPQEKESGDQPDWSKAAFPGGLAELALNQFGKMKQMNIHRSEIAKQYLLAQIPSVQSLQNANLERVWLRYPVLVANPKQAMQQFRSSHIIVGDWYDQVVGPLSVDLTKTGYQLGTAPVAEEVSAHILNLPVHPRMPLSRVSDVVRVYTKEVEPYGN